MYEGGSMKAEVRGMRDEGVMTVKGNFWFRVQS